MTKKRDKPLHLDMSFDEALRRIAQTDPHELAVPKKKERKKAKGAARPDLPAPSPRNPQS